MDVINNLPLHEISMYVNNYYVDRINKLSLIINSSFRVLGHNQKINYLEYAIFLHMISRDDRSILEEYLMAKTKRTRHKNAIIAILNNLAIDRVTKQIHKYGPYARRAQIALNDAIKINYIEKNRNARNVRNVANLIESKLGKKIIHAFLKV